MTHPPSGPSTPTPPPGPKTRPYGHLPIALPQKVDQIGAAIRCLTQAINALGRITDPLSAPDDDQPLHDLLETQAVGHIVWAHSYLAELADRFPQTTRSPNRVRGLLPGLAAADPDPTAACESSDALASVRAGDSSAPPT